MGQGQLRRKSPVELARRQVIIVLGCSVVGLILTATEDAPPERSGGASSIPGYRVPRHSYGLPTPTARPGSNCSRLSNSPGSRTHSPLGLASVAFQTSTLCPRSRPVRPPDRRDTRSRCIDRHGAFWPNRRASPAYCISSFVAGGVSEGAVT
jgi:hypothetical protein